MVSHLRISILKDQSLSSPVFHSPKSGEIVGVYLAHSVKVVSSVVFIHQIGKLIYFLIKKLAGAGLNYPTMISGHSPGSFG